MQHDTASQSGEFPEFRTVGELRRYCEGRPDDSYVLIEWLDGARMLARGFSVTAEGNLVIRPCR